MMRLGINPIRNLKAWGVPPHIWFDYVRLRGEAETSSSLQCAWCEMAPVALPGGNFVKVAEGIYMHELCAHYIEPRAFGPWY